MTDSILPADPAPLDTLDTLEAVATFLAAAFDSGDGAVLAAALARAAQADGFPHLAAAAGLPRDQLATAFATGAMRLDTTLAVMKVIDLWAAGRH
jgi:probable addiction module antidote protein